MSMKPMETEYNKAIEEERTRIARELHDGPIQMMVHIGHKLEFVQCLLANQAVESAQNELRQVHGILETCLHTLRNDIFITHDSTNPVTRCRRSVTNVA